MRSSNAVRLALAAILVFTTTAWIACNSANTGATSPAATGGGKVPLTTKSEDARKEYLQGRDLSEKLLAQDSLQHFDAIWRVLDLTGRFQEHRDQPV